MLDTDSHTDHQYTTSENNPEDASFGEGTIEMTEAVTFADITSVNNPPSKSKNTSQFYFENDPLPEHYCVVVNGKKTAYITT